MYVVSEESARTKLCPAIPTNETCRTYDCIAWIKWHFEEWETNKPESGYCSLIHNRN